MAWRTQDRGRRDTTDGPSKRTALALGSRELGSRHVRALVLALILHFPLLPSGATRLLFGAMLATPAPQPAASSREVVVPIELDLGLFGEEVPPAAAPPSVAPAGGQENPQHTTEPWSLAAPKASVRIPVDPPKTRRKKRRRKRKRRRRTQVPPSKPSPKSGAGGAAGRPKPSPRAAVSAAPNGSASASASAVPRKKAPTPAPAAPATSAKAKPRLATQPASPRPEGRVKDPSEVAGGAAKVGARQPNVRIYLAADVLRKTPLGQRFGTLLAAIPQWQQLMAGTGLHPIRDFNQILLSGPQMRDPRHLVATASYRVEVQRVKKAIDRVIARSRPKGRWLRGFGVPVAAIGRGLHRRVVLLPQKRMLVVLPARAEKKIAQVRKMRGFRTSGKTAAALYIITPWRGFMNTPIAFPKSIRWLRLRVSMPRPGAFMLAVEARDKDAASAAKNKQVLQRLVDEIRPHPLVPASGLLGVYLFDRPTFWVKGDLIRGRVELKEKQVSTLLNLVDRWLRLQQAARAPAAPKRPKGRTKP